MTRVLLVVAGVVLAIVAALVLYLTFADLGRFKPQIETSVSQALGREFRIAGELKPKVLPRLSIVAAGITLANADWGAPAPMVEVGQVRGEIRLWSLLFGPITIENLELRDVAILLEQNAAGDGNWAIAPSDAAPEPQTGGGWEGLPVIIEIATVANASVVFKRPETADVSAAVSALTLRGDESGRLAAEADGQVRDIPFAVSASLAPSNGRAEVDLNGSFAETEVLAHVFIGAEQVDFDASVAEIKRVADAFSITGLPALSLRLEGSANLGEDLIRVDGLKASLGENDFAGSIEVALGDAVRVAVKGESQLIDLAPLQASPAAAADEETPEPPQDEQETRWLFGEEELPFEQMAATSLAVKLEIADLRNGDMQARNVSLALDGDGKTLKIETRFEVAAGGSAEGNVVLTAAGNSAELAIDMSARDLRVNIASGDVDDPEQVPPVGLSASLRSRGSSPRALAAGANGSVLFTQGGGRIDNSVMDMASGGILAQLFGALNPMAKEEPFTKWDCTVVRLNVENGLGELSPMLGQAEKLTIVGAGKIDLRSEELDIEFNTKPRTGVGLTADMFVTPFVKVSGTLAQPGIGMNKSGTLLAGGAAVLTGGMSLLAKGVADRATAEGDQCAEALAEAADPAQKSD